MEQNKLYILIALIAGILAGYFSTGYINTEPVVDTTYQKKLEFIVDSLKNQTNKHQVIVDSLIKTGSVKVKEIKKIVFREPTTEDEQRALEWAKSQSY